MGNRSTRHPLTLALPVERETIALPQISRPSPAGLRPPALRRCPSYSRTGLGGYRAPSGYLRPVRKHGRLLHPRFQCQLSVHSVDSGRRSALSCSIVEFHKRGTDCSLRQTCSSNEAHQPDSSPDGSSARGYRANCPRGRLRNITSESSRSVRHTRYDTHLHCTEPPPDNNTPISQQDPAYSGNQPRRNNSRSCYGRLGG